MSAPQHCQGGDDRRQSVREVIAIGPSSLQRLTIFGSDRRDRNFRRSGWMIPPASQGRLPAAALCVLARSLDPCASGRADL